MARFSRIEVALEMKRQGVIPVFYHADAEICKQVLKASYAAGIRVFEFTNRGDFAHEVFGTLNRWAATELPELMLGVGSVVDAPTAALYIQLGAAFVVSPLLNEEMAPVCNRRKILWAPGCGSLSEIGRAEELGAEIVKIFPGSSVGGPGFVKAVKGPCPWSSIMPTGGVEPTEESLRAWFEAGVTCVGMGSNLFPKKLIEAGDWNAITETIGRIRAIIASVRP
ncbi:bifunctional 4-hydroxy-2-oxoglutarate aldolase/2-dehydro-3-deoxy-phosphogluconate aldolase [uncultured Rikenella sp.]|uniref:bifunctional 4-hydroxy-2-oxoglutarate aldolase/2-dehydro-3-deoxy-phosphogluconate aldolase n=1 Tax=uncultured Rikenella sp. TaxID=368003 RepID=UPI002631ACBA|nr:bifunctional 4-hydroxy-2-oxoglutarate aldolase/2-dehydro-3-deoxy-phosphogluconate aldolase [uncultured Rikenella sp.]